MSKFIFENEEEYDLYNIVDCEVALVSAAYVWSPETLQILLAGKWESVSAHALMDRKCVYRVLAENYTLEDAKQAICEEAASRKSSSNSLDPEHKVGAKFAMGILDKLAASMEGDK